MRIYSEPSRADDMYSLPDVEIFYNKNEIPEIGVGYFWWSCFPGCLPDSDPIGPFKTVNEAIQNAQEGASNV